MPTHPDCAACGRALPSDARATRLYCGATCRSRAHRALHADDLTPAREALAARWAEVRRAVARRCA